MYIIKFKNLLKKLKFSFHISGYLNLTNSSDLFHNNYESSLS